MLYCCNIYISLHLTVYCVLMSCLVCLMQSCIVWTVNLWLVENIACNILQFPRGLCWYWRAEQSYAACSICLFHVCPAFIDQLMFAVDLTGMWVVDRDVDLMKIGVLNHWGCANLKHIPFWFFGFTPKPPRLHAVTCIILSRQFPIGAMQEHKVVKELLFWTLCTCWWHEWCISNKVIVLQSLKQDAQLSQRDRAAGCVIVFAKSRRLELGDNILRTV